MSTSPTPQTPAYAVVIPTVGRPCLAACLDALAAAAKEGPAPARIVVVDDRRASATATATADCCTSADDERHRPLSLDALGELADRATVLTTGGSGPAAARNAGWRATDEPWVVFLDDDVVVEPGWATDLAADLADAAPHVVGVQGDLHVPLPTDRRPTDWERNTAGLADAAWVTADIAYRRSALERVDGFDERFRRAFREDADLALRMVDQGFALRRGHRRTTHPVRPADRWVSVRAQAGNSDDVLMTHLHGPDWWARAEAPRGRLPMHLAVTAAGAGALALAAVGARRTAVVAAALWLAGTAEFTLLRLRPGPRTPDEVATMVATSAAIPPVATWHWLRGQLRYGPLSGAVPRPRAGR